MLKEISAEATDVQRRFAYWKRQAQRTPVIVKNHGQDEIVMMAAGEYDRLMRRQRRVIKAGEFTEEQLEAIRQSHVPPEYNHLDDALLKDWNP
jgi:PHD/YefM family antitoxin component YafN of YafNO toxin-antitoxin module